MKRLPSLPLAVLLGVLISGCSSPQPAVPEEGAQPIEEGWWNNPGAIRDRLAVIGSAPYIGNVSNARDRAYTNALGTMAAALQSRVTQLRENWAKEVGDLAAGEESYTSLINDESITRVYTDARLAGATPHKFRMVGDTQYVLVTLRDPVEWTENVLNSLEEAALQQETLWKTEAMKDKFRERMDTLKDEQKQRVQEQKEALDQL